MKLHSNKRQKTQFFRGIWYCQHMMTQPWQAQNHGKYDNNEKGRFDDDNKISYKYILSIN